MPTFYEMGLDQPVIQAILNMGFEETTPIQALAIPAAMNNRDIIGQAQTSAKEMRLGARDYADEILIQIENVLNELGETINNNRNELKGMK